jgi:hypothetical protein
VAVHDCEEGNCSSVASSSSVVTSGACRFGWCYLGRCCSTLVPSPSGRDGEGRGSGGSVASSRWPRPSLWWYNDDKRNHADIIIASAIFGWQGGPCLTSIKEAFHRFCWSSARPRCQVVHPRRLGGAQRWRFFARRGHLCDLPLFLGNYALSLPATCSEGTRGPDCFSIFRSTVFSFFCKCAGLIFKY